MPEERIKALLEKRIDERLFPGAVCGITDKTGNRTVVPAGRLTYEVNSPMVTAETIYDTASITKVIPTAGLAMQLIEENKLNAEDKLISYIPEFNNSDREKVLIKHLLTFTLDFSFKLSAQKDKSPEEILKTVYTSEFNSPPGSKFYYHNAASLLLGMTVERITGQSLDLLAEERFFRPLSMNRTSFYPLRKFKPDEIAPSEVDDWRGREMRGEVHDESAFALRPKLISGSAGLFSTAVDLLNFMEMLLSGGSRDGIKYFSEAVIQKMETNQIPETGSSHGWGFDVNNPAQMGSFCGEKTFAKTGFTGCMVGADREKNVAWVVLANCKYPHRTDNLAVLNLTRSEIADMVFSGK